MNWYYEKQGVSQGPYPEPEILALVQSKQIGPQSLIWRSDLEEWDTVQVLRPDWLEQPKPEPVKKSSTKQTVPRTDGPLPSEPAKAAQLPKPKAGLEKTEGTEKVGLLSRLFGFGKKKKDK